MEELTEAQLQERRKARLREGIPDRLIRAKAKQLGWSRTQQTLDQFMFEVHMIRYGTGKDARWFQIKWE